MTHLDEPLSPFARHLGYRLVAWSDGAARLEMPVADFVTNRSGIPHGGVHATLLDTAMGYSGCFTGDSDAPRTCVTLMLSVQYLSRPEGRLLIAEGRQTGGGRRTFFAEADLTDETGHLIAKGTGSFRYRG